MIDSHGVYTAIRRGYHELASADPLEIQTYFEGLDKATFVGHVSNIKGILFEQEVTNALNAQGIDAQMFSMTNHPVSDIALFENGDLVGEIQLKATDSVSYIQSVLDRYENMPIVTTSEVAEYFDSSFVIDSGIDNQMLEDSVAMAIGGELPDRALEVGAPIADEELGDLVTDTISPFPFSPIGLIGSLLGFPFLF